ncbi:hypothetical protein GCM10007981_14570 [Thermocladium modestius]|uniref:Uncharacterized protein n=1 Tax=Thermocladium modestius TaxID=62609 RepID=A0A830GXI6_9CREN|nr:hypothetical protein [Thermocladium modestius]GGP21700.1 hypothetical protein GCM10007981_14570 [Thermocladium modestius]
MDIKRLKLGVRCSPDFDGIATNFLSIMNEYLLDDMRNCVKAVYVDAELIGNLLASTGLLRFINSNGVEVIIPSGVPLTVLSSIKRYVDRVAVHLSSGESLSLAVDGLSLSSMSPNLDLLDYPVERLYVLLSPIEVRKGFNLISSVPLLDASRLRSVSLVFP